MDIRKHYSKLVQRRFDAKENVLLLSEAAKSLKDSESLRYLLGAMEEVGTRYTEITFRAGERVRDQLAEAFITQGTPIEFDFQGSATNNTHIRLHSDIDLLVAHNAFFSHEQGAYIWGAPYKGDTLSDMRGVRETCIEELKSRFWKAKVTPGSKSIKIAGGSLERDVDVVPCNWYKNKAYESTGAKQLLGVRILDIEVGLWIYNFPFLHNHRINEKDLSTGGGLRKMIRLLKSLKEDADQTIKASSYDICGIAYNMDAAALRTSFMETDIEFVKRFLDYSKAVVASPTLQGTMKVPNGSRDLFSGDGLQPAELRKLNQELEELLKEIGQSAPQGLTRQYRTLAEILYGTQQ